MSLLRTSSMCLAGFFLIELLLSHDLGLAAEVRTWTDAAGRKTEAKFVRVFNGEVILEKDGRALKVPLSRFSAADQKYIREMTSSAAQPAESASKDDAQRAAAGVKGNSAPPSNEPDARAAEAELRRMRDWRDTAGNVINARFERIFGQQVILTVGNRLRAVDFSRLSTADQDFLRRNMEAMGENAKVPTVVASTRGAIGTSPLDATDANQRDSTSPAATGTPASEIGQGLGFPGPGVSSFRDIANRMRQHQEQIRATQDQIRAQVQQMHDDMRAVREQTVRPTIPGRATLPNPIAESAVTSTPPSGATTMPDTAAGPSLAASSIPSVSAERTIDPFATPATVDRPDHATPGPMFDRIHTSPAPDLQPEAPFARAPPIGPQYEAVVVCGACNKAQKPGFKAGQRCQHCGRTIDEITDESGEVVERSSKSTRRNIRFWVWAVIAGISVVGGLIAKLKGS